MTPPYLYLLLLLACTSEKSQKVSTHELINADQNPKEWLTYGLNYAETRFSQLDKISEKNVDQLGLAWYYEMGADRGVESTPLISDGIMFLTGPWSKVFALDAKTGEEIWQFDPEVPGEYGEKACCDVVNRGVALYGDKVYVGTFDGRLVALRAKTGEKVSEKMMVDQSIPYTITGAPRVYKGKVIIGNGGAEYGVRGHLTAYDAETGEQAWRFHSVPGDPSKPFESKAMEDAAKTWTGKFWEAGGGGTMWDAMAYDPELNLMYVGTGNGSPWNRRHRSPEGGDNLYLSSIVALNPDNGEMEWYYQTTPGDNWDYTATQHMILAELEIKGKERKVIMQAPKNGFFYVLDRTNGELISAEPFVEVNWASHVDYETGRPVENSEAAYYDQPYEAVPGPYGGHNWQPMSFNNQTGLVYIPAQTVSMVMLHDPNYKFGDPSATMAIAAGNGWNHGALSAAMEKQYPVFGKLIAWDPVQQKKVWEVEHAAPSNGGVLSTAGNLVFQGTSDGNFAAFNASTGDKLWESHVGTGVIAPPITYEIDGEQYVSIPAGWGGVMGLTISFSPYQTTGKIYTFKIGGDKPMPKFLEPAANPKLKGVSFHIESEAEVMEGLKLYLNYCYICHGMPAESKGGRIPNLGYSTTETINQLKEYVLGGDLLQKGMPDFTNRVSEVEVENIKAFIQLAADGAFD